MIYHGRWLAIVFAATVFEAIERFWKEFYPELIPDNSQLKIEILWN